MEAKKSFGQHFLHDQRVVKAIIAAAELQPGECVLEIGPGKGVLTEALQKTGAKIVAVEADKDLIAGLQARFSDAITLIRGNALDRSLWRDQIPASGYKLVSNLPYNIASAVIEQAFTEAPRPTSMVIMVQKEVADRILAEPGDMSVLSVACQVYATGSRVVDVPPEAFKPQPKVDSTVVRLDLIAERSEGWISEPEELIALAKVGFRSRRKQLHRNLADAGVIDSEQSKALFEQIGLLSTARAQELAIADWVRLRNLIANR